MDRFRSILNSTFITTYKRTIAVLFIFALTLAIPVTILLVQQRQDLQQQAAGIASVSGKVIDQNNNPVQPPGAKVVLVRQSDKNEAKVNVKPDGTYTFGVFKEDTFVLNIELPQGYSVTSFPNDHKPLVIAKGQNITNQNFKLKTPPFSDVKGRFNTACLSRFSGWACQIKQGGKIATVRFYKVVGGKETLLTGSATQANQPGRFDAKFDDPPVGAEAACDLTEAENTHVYYYFTPKDGSIKVGDQVVGYIEAIDGQVISPRIKLVTSESANGIKIVKLTKPLPNGVDVCKDQEPAVKYSISGMIFVDKDGDKNYDASKDRPYYGNNGKKVIVQRSGCTDPKQCQVEPNSGGKYIFNDLTPGTYTIDVVQVPDPSVYTADTKHPLTVVVNSARPNPSDANFGYKPNANEPVTQKFRISGTVLVKTPSGQRPYRGAQGAATITLVDKATNGQKVKETTTTTVADNGVVGIGSYSFDKEQQVPTGTYTVSVSLPTSAQAIYTILEPKIVTLNVNAIQKDVNFLLEEKGSTPEDKNFSISGVVYVEKSAVKDVGSEYNPGVDEVFKDATVKLQSTPSCPNNTGGKCPDTNLSTKSGADGKYQFKDQASGNRYTVSITLPEGYRAATPDSRSFDLVKDRIDVNFGIIKKDTTPDVPSNLAISIKMPGIGNQGAAENNAPVRPDREADVIVYNVANDEVANQVTTVTYEPASGLYKGTLVLDKVPGGTYAVKAKLDNTLYRFFRNPSTNNPLIDITSGKTTTLPTLTLIAGDLDNNQDANQKAYLTVFDYDKIMSCFRNESSCSASDKILSDLNDDGTVDAARDLNILFQGLSIRNSE